MEGNHSEELLTLALDIGEQMLLSGAEIYRVEDAMRRICRAYRCRRVDVFSITSHLQATLEDEEGNFYTQTRRVLKSTTDLNRLHRLNCLSRTLCASTPELKTAREEYEKVLKESRPNPRALTFLAYFIVAGAFALLFGGSLLDAGVSALIALFLCAAAIGLEKLDFNPLLSKMICTFLISVPSLLCARFIPQIRPDQVVIGNIMLLIPGVALTNSIRDLFCGDLISGILRLMESVIQALAIAAGYAIAALLTGVSGGGGIAVNAILQNPFIQVYFAFMGALAFGILYHITRSRLLFASLGGALSWGIYLAFAPLVPNEGVRFFIAAAIATVYAEIMARIQKTPTTTYLVPSIIPLIPGGHLYRTMNFAITGDWEPFFSEGLLTLQLALALAAGIIVITSLTTAFKKIFPHRKKRRAALKTKAK